MHEQVKFEDDLAKVISKHNVDSELGMANFLIAEMLTKFLSAIRVAKVENQRLGYGKINEEG